MRQLPVGHDVPCAFYLFVRARLGSGSSVLPAPCVPAPHGGKEDGCLGIILHEIAMENDLDHI